MSGPCASARRAVVFHPLITAARTVALHTDATLGSQLFNDDTTTGASSGTPPTLSLPAGWSATLQANGNDLQLVVTAAP